MDKLIDQYKMVAQAGNKEFVHRVNENIKNGWQPYGSLFGIKVSASEEVEEGDAFFCQAMVRYE